LIDFGDRRLLGVVLAAHLAFLVAGFLGEFWLMTGFCLWIRPAWIQIGLGIFWLGLTLSPIVGIPTLIFGGYPRTYIALALATPAFFFLVMWLNQVDVLMCDAP
jgi:hypothetical protein